MMVGVPVALAVIPARGGSKGIVGKNLSLVGGISLIERAVAAARDATTISRVVVTTDDPAIAAATRAAGGDVVDRPAELAGDEASSESAVLHALDTLRDAGTPDPDVVVMIQCTSPFVLPADIDGVVGALEAQGTDCAFSATPSHAFVWRLGEGSATGVNHDERVRLRRQDRAPEWIETGAVYAMRTDVFRRAAHRFCGSVALYEVPPLRAMEIDEPDDLARARVLAPLVEARDRARRLPNRVAAVVLDFDGVLTDNRVLTTTDGVEAVSSDRSDGLGIERLRKAGIPVMVLSKEQNPVVTARCRKLGIECVQGTDDKIGAMSALLATHELEWSEVVFVGNDINDVECLRAAGLGVAVADAWPAAVAAADLVLTRAGGRGAVRELADLILASREAPR